MSKTHTISPMKIQKLVYLAHGWYLAVKGKPLIDDPIQAWHYGPVIPNLYQEFKKYGEGPIKRFALEYNPYTNEPLTVASPNDESTIQILNKVYDFYGGFSAIQLSNLTHKQGTPWADTWGEGDIPSGTPIDNDKIKEHFISLAGSKVSF